MEYVDTLKTDIHRVESLCRLHLSIYSPQLGAPHKLAGPITYLIHNHLSIDPFTPNTRIYKHATQLVHYRSITPDSLHVRILLPRLGNTPRQLRRKLMRGHNHSHALLPLWQVRLLLL